MSSDTAVLDEPKTRTRAKASRVATATAATPKARTGPTAAVAATTGKATAKAATARATRFKAAQEAANQLKQVSDWTRLLIIHMLADGERHVGALCERLDQSQPAVSHHLAILRHSGIISPRRQGKMNFYALTDKGRELAAVVQTVMGT